VTHRPRWACDRGLDQMPGYVLNVEEDGSALTSQRLRARRLRSEEIGEEGDDQATSTGSSDIR